MSVDPRISPRFRRLVEAACARLELAPVGGGTTITLDLDLDTALRVERDDSIALGSAALASPAMTALCLRHGMELALLRGLTPRAAAVARDLAAGLLAIRTAGFYLEAMGPAERASCRSLLSRWQREAVDLLTVPRPEAVPKDMLASIARPLLALQGRDFRAAAAGARDPVDWPLVSDILKRAEGLAMPVELLVTETADACGLPPEARQAAEALRRELLSAALLGDIDAACASEWQRRTGGTGAGPEPAALLRLAARGAGG